MGTGQIQLPLENRAFLISGTRFFNVLDEFRHDIHGVDVAFLAHRSGEQAREQAGARTHVSHRHAGLQPARFHDLLALGENLAAFALELGDVLLDIDLGILKGFVDARANTLVLSVDGETNNQAKGENKGEAKESHGGTPKW